MHEIKWKGPSHSLVAPSSSLESDSWNTWKSCFKAQSGAESIKLNVASDLKRSREHTCRKAGVASIVSRICEVHEGFLSLSTFTPLLQYCTSNIMSNQGSRGAQIPNRKMPGWAFGSWSFPNLSLIARFSM